MTRLTEEMVIARSRQSDLASIKKLNCWGSELSDVSIIKRMHGVEVLALSVNRVSSLADFEDCRKLQELYLRKNNIQDLNDLAYLQGLPHLKSLWLEENPCVDRAGPTYRQIVLRALPNLKKLDNVDVTPEELAEALSDVSIHQQEEDVYEDAYNEGQQYQQQQSTHPQPAHHQPVQHKQQEYQSPQQQPPTPQQQQWRSNSPPKELRQSSDNGAEDSVSEPIIDRNSIPSSPLQRTPPSQEFQPAEPPSPKYNRDHRNSYHQAYEQKSPISDHDISMQGFKERGPMSQSMSTHSMKEYYQSDRPTHPHYRHSQTDLTEWDENGHTDHNNRHSHPHHQYSTPHHRRSGPHERESSSAGYHYRNGSKDKDDWDDVSERSRKEGRRAEGRFNDNGSVVSSAVLNHYNNFYRRPVNRSSNLLSATLCLVKELDYPSLEVVEHAVRCRIDELATD